MIRRSGSVIWLSVLQGPAATSLEVLGHGRPMSNAFGRAHPSIVGGITSSLPETLHATKNRVATDPRTGPRLARRQGSDASDHDQMTDRSMKKTENTAAACDRHAHQSYANLSERKRTQKNADERETKANRAQKNA